MLKGTSLAFVAAVPELYTRAHDIANTNYFIVEMLIVAAIRIFSRRGYGQLIREEGPAGHATKRGTPTMGGTVIVIAAVVGYFTGNIFTGQEPSVSGVLVLFLMVGLGVVGLQFRRPPGGVGRRAEPVGGRRVAGPLPTSKTLPPSCGARPDGLRRTRLSSGTSVQTRRALNSRVRYW